MRLVGAPAGSGIVFRRVDLDGFEIPANGRNVAKVSYATSLMRGSVLISTTEHLLSALVGFGVDNVIVEVDTESGTASSRSYFTVLQAVANELALQPVIAGRYRDRFVRVDGRWRFSAVHMIVDLVGDLGHHMLFDLPS